jgi:type IV pilus assembly protein PilV
MKVSQQKFRRLQLGVGMLEVMIALVVLVFGALGFAGLQLTALRNTSHANYRAHATLIAQDAIERVIANYDQIAAYRSEASWGDAASVTLGGEPPDWKKCMDAACSRAEMAAWDIAQVGWVAANAMPNGQVIVKSCEFNALDCVVVSWADQDPGNCTSAAGIESGNDSACLVLEVAR